jgi:hypothetical protein
MEFGHKVLLQADGVHREWSSGIKCCCRLMGCIGNTTQKGCSCSESELAAANFRRSADFQWAHAVTCSAFVGGAGDMGGDGRGEAGFTLTGLRECGSAACGDTRATWFGAGAGRLFGGWEFKDDATPSATLSATMHHCGVAAPGL